MPSLTWETGLGLLRDLVVAIIGLIALFGVDISNEQTGGILLLVATAGAFGVWAFNSYQNAKKESK
jgi:hypothetical protein